MDGEGMRPVLTTQTRNTVTVMLMQAMWGVISPNFRRVAWALLDHAWTVQFVLERDDAEDREEIEDAMGDFDALLLEIESGPRALLSEVIVSAQPLSALDLNTWLPIYIRREKLIDSKTLA